MNPVTQQVASARESFADFLRTRLSGPLPVELLAQIHSELRHSSATIQKGNFDRISETDLEWLFAAYDDLIFDGQLGHIARLPGFDLTFRLSSRMTNAGGTTTRRVTRSRRLSRGARISHEIAVSTTLLFQTFSDVDRTITVTGLECHDRLEALQRVFEHELVHLIELLLTETSSCSKRPFATLAGGLFGHREMTHRLITPKERAATKFGLRAGDRVAFTHEGRIRVGVINRITKRATVLVEDARGQRYSDGKHYSKFYVPVESLTKAG